MGYHILQQQNRKYELGYFHGCVLGESLILGTEGMRLKYSNGNCRVIGQVHVCTSDDFGGIADITRENGLCGDFCSSH